MRLCNPRLNQVEAALLDEVSADALMSYTEQVAAKVRLSGSDEELESFRYVQRQLEDWGLSTQLLFHDGYVSWPGAATLQIEGLGDIACITHAMAVSTPGTSGGLVYAGRGRPADYEALTVQGQIVVIEGLAAPAPVKEAIRHGAVALIFINDDHFHEMITSPVWGSPTPDQLGQLPTTPIISIRRPDGERLKQHLLLHGTAAPSARITAEVDTRWRKLPLLEAWIPGHEGEPYVLFSGHIDSWHLGAMDNGSANATMMEVARILSRHGSDLQRGLRLCFWSGHSHGRYAGSAWYADSFWHDLRERCVAHVNIDSVGGMGATVLTEAFAMAETADLGKAVIPNFAGSRPSRSGDQSFLALGIPSLLMTLSEQELEPGVVGPAAITGSKAGGSGWWWHTVDDTVDKLDPAFLARDCQIYLAVVFRLCAERVLPFHYGAAIHEYRSLLEQYAARAGDLFDLAPALEAAQTLKAAYEPFGSEVERLREEDHHGRPCDPDQVKRANERLMALGRRLIPGNYTTQGPFAQDPALPIAPMPLLAPIGDLVAAGPESDVAKHMLVGLRRARNRIVQDLMDATRDLI
jgi:hypothetical protein